MYCTNIRIIIPSRYNFGHCNRKTFIKRASFPSHKEFSCFPLEYTTSRRLLRKFVEFLVKVISFCVIFSFYFSFSCTIYSREKLRGSRRINNGDGQFGVGSTFLFNFYKSRLTFSLYRNANLNVISVPRFRLYYF